MNLSFGFAKRQVLLNSGRASLAQYRYVVLTRSRGWTMISRLSYDLTRFQTPLWLLSCYYSALGTVLYTTSRSASSSCCALPNGPQLATWT